MLIKIHLLSLLYERVYSFSYLLHKKLALQRRVTVNRFWQRRKQSIDLDGAIVDDEFAVGTAPLTADTNIQSNSHSTSSPANTSLQVQASCQTEQNAKEDWAATVIQTAFRAFLVQVPIPFIMDM